VPRHERLRRLDTEALCEHRAERDHLHVAEPGQLPDPPFEVGCGGRVTPHQRRVPFVLLVDDRRELPDTLCHVSGEAVHGGLLAAGGVEGVRGHRGVAGCVEVPETLPQLQRSRERRLHRHLLVEREPDQQRKRLACEHRVRVGIAGEVERGTLRSYSVRERDPGPRRTREAPVAEPLLP